MLAYNHNNLSGHQQTLKMLQEPINNYMLAYRRLLTKRLHMAKQLCYSKLRIFEKQQNLFVQGYNHTYVS